MTERRTGNAVQGRAAGIEDGYQLVEVAMAVGLVAVAVIGLVGAIGLGFTVTGAAKQRSAASAVASESIERVRTMTFEQVALKTAPSTSSDPDHPDHKVTPAGAYEVDDSSVEPLVVDSANGLVEHIEVDVVRSRTTFDVYRYVTWVDDPAIAGTEDYKRVTVVALPDKPHSARVGGLAMSTFMSEGTVTVPTSSPPPPPSPAPSGSPGPTPTPAQSCETDTFGPNGTVEILSGTGADPGYTGSTTFQVSLTASDGCAPITAHLSNTGSTFSVVGTLMSGQAKNVSWSVPAGDGTKVVYARFTDGVANQSATYQDSIVLDTTAPSPPEGLHAASCSVQGSDRTVTLAWNSASDATLAGYYVYRSINFNAWQVVATTAMTTATDTEKKNHPSVRYIVRAFDHAGNLSGESQALLFVVSLDKNRC